MSKKTVRDIDVAGKRVLVRVDFNVPLDRSTGTITDDTRISAAVPTIAYLVGKRSKVILVSHLGRPGGKVTEDLRMKQVATRLQEFLSRPVAYASDCVGPDAKAAVEQLGPGDVLLLENVRFHSGEEANEPEFATELASLADVYVNDAFGSAHRAHASTEGVTHSLPAVAGLLMERELNFLGRATENPARPYAAIVGGAKISDKIGVLKKLVNIVDKLLIGGGMANTFLKAQGYGMGSSLVEDDQLTVAKAIMNRATARGIDLLLPIDVAVATAFAADVGREVVELSEDTKKMRPAVPEGSMALDIGPATVSAYTLAVRDCGTIVWNGPMGVFEFPNFAMGTTMLADAVAATGATTIIGGGETAAAIHAAGVADRISHISTGGGASLEFLEGRQLPGVAALLDK